MVLRGKGRLLTARDSLVGRAQVLQQNAPGDPVDDEVVNYREQAPGLRWAVVK